MRQDKPDWAESISEHCLSRLEKDGVPGKVATCFFAQVLPSEEITIGWNFQELEDEAKKEYPIYRYSTLFRIRISNENFALCSLIAVCRRYLRFINTRSPKEYLLKGEMDKREIILFHKEAMRRGYDTLKRSKQAALKSVAARKESTKDRNDKIKQHAVEIEKKEGQRKVARTLADRFSLSQSQIRKILR